MAVSLQSGLAECPTARILTKTTKALNVVQQGLAFRWCIMAANSVQTFLKIVEIGNDGYHFLKIRGFLEHIDSLAANNSPQAKEFIEQLERLRNFCEAVAREE